ncbi:MAG: bifunctional methylenetetrahydrofolate dehydrogenase/methenyltetrahydrofolate cyclohydrolase FolD, partial [Gammaproteobacteria bacterium]|nr:bifunctional methylenetetrahydrofolate dehydrogenase/methenyltetrahydrofolate cyclohydrolase FolD [Gammaproteobacteria bacterium]
AVASRRARGLRIPGLAVILVGEDPASEIYVKHKRRDCEQVGILSQVQALPSATTQAQLLDRIDALNADPAIDGILVQLPLPGHIDSSTIIERIEPTKDVDGYHPYNIGRLALRQPVLRSCTPKGIMQLLAHTGVAIRGMNATIVGASNHVGRPMGLELLLAGCTVTTAHKFSRNTKACVGTADILVSATGSPGLIRGEWIKEGAIVVDVGIVRDAAGKLTGDVDFAQASQRASWITPVPGGVGPMTRVALLQNTIYAAEHFHS